MGSVLDGSKIYRILPSGVSEVRWKTEIDRPDPCFSLPRPAVLLPKFGLCSEVSDFSPHFRKARLNRASRSENHRIFVSTQMRSLFCQAESCIQTKKRADASALFRCRPKASSAIDLIQIDITCLTTITSTSRSRPCSIIPLPGWCLASTSHIAYMKKGQHSQFESVTLKAPKELLYCRKILYTIFPWLQVETDAIVISSRKRYIK